MLVDNSLVAVVSLPAGCFNPYSGVKTSILILDKSLAKAADTIAFFRVENDGFGLGAQRRAIEKNDLPQVQVELAAYLQALRTKASTESILAVTSTAQIVPKEKIAANGDYNLSGERYREGAERASSYPHVRLEEVARVTSGNSAPQGDEYFAGGEAAFIRTSDVGAVHLSDNYVGSADKVNAKALAELRLELFPSGTILFPKSGASTFLNHRVVMGAPAYVSSHLACIICDERMPSTSTACCVKPGSVLLRKCFLVEWSNATGRASRRNKLPRLRISPPRTARRLRRR
jgi:type I restriction enzyme M protein